MYKAQSSVSSYAPPKEIRFNLTWGTDFHFVFLAPVWLAINKTLKKILDTTLLIIYHQLCKPSSG